tara:strand:+ start:13 stop:231 length:219 start_codon:yes stop_codon:yes gene_type:complete
MTKTIEDITQYDDDELSIRIDNDEDAYEIRHEPSKLLNYIENKYIYNKKQVQILWIDTWWTYQDSIKDIEFY